MEQEYFLSGYCRQQDQSRMVTLETEDGRLSDVDCCYGTCPYEHECTVAAAIRQRLQPAAD